MIYWSILLGSVYCSFKTCSFCYNNNTLMYWPNKSPLHISFRPYHIHTETFLILLNSWFWTSEKLRKYQHGHFYQAVIIPSCYTKLCYKNNKAISRGIQSMRPFCWKIVKLLVINTTLFIHIMPLYSISIQYEKLSHELASNLLKLSSGEKKRNKENKMSWNLIQSSHRRMFLYFICVFIWK